jgi:hypothetical protein
MLEAPAAAASGRYPSSTMTPADLLTRFGPVGRGAARRRCWARRLRRLEKPARVAAQTAVAALATFGLFKVTGLPQASWAVISALFVIQPNVGGTIGTALGRIAGTALGTVCGLARVPGRRAIELGDRSRPSRGHPSLGFITGFRPGLRYGLVPAAFILLAPHGEALEKAWHGAAAIGLGAVQRHVRLPGAGASRSRA